MDIQKLPLIYIVILTCNGQKLVASCLASLEKLITTGLRIKTIVVDNGSKDTTVEFLVKQYPKVIVIDNQVNYGFAKGINYGLKLAFRQGANYLLLLNDDTLLPKDFLIKLVTQAQEQSYPIIGPKILTSDQKIWSLGGNIDKKRFSGSLIGYGNRDFAAEKETEVDFISGTAMLVKREVFEKIGFMDEDYFLYYDDCDFCIRARRVGFKSYIVPTAKITHLETITIKKNSASHFYHARKSNLLFIFKRAPFLTKLRELLRIPKTILELYQQKDKTKRKCELLAMVDFFAGKFGQDSSIKPF